MSLFDKVDLTKIPEPIFPDKSDKPSKLVESVAELLEKIELKDGMTLSFHHHLRNGDAVVGLVMEEVQKKGIKGLTLAISSIFPVHAPLVKLLDDGTVVNIVTSYMSGPVADAVSEGRLRGKLVMQSHGGRARAIMSGELPIDVAFIAAPACDVHGNVSAVEGRAFCGVLGYAAPDAIMAKTVVAMTDTLLTEETHTEIPQERIDYIVKVDSIGDPSGIISGTTRITKDPVGLAIAKKAVEVMVATGLVREGFNYQSGAGGTSLAVTKYLADYMLANGIHGGFASGGITEDLVAMMKNGLFRRLYDVQCFDLKSALSVKDDANHYAMSAEKYASPNADPIVNGLDFVILGATEVDLDFNVNVTTGHDGYIMGGSGGHQDTAFGAKVSIIVSKLFQSRIPLVVDRVGVISTPGSTVDILVTERGVAVNERRADLIDILRKAGVSFMTIRELKEIEESIIGTPEPKTREGRRVIGVSEYRDGRVLDVIYGVS